jgi:tRNA-binding EMAP/Myf-like protein
VLAEVVLIKSIKPHPNAERLDLVEVQRGEGKNVTLVTGPHYRAGSRGVWIHPDTRIPGYLARDLWLSGSGNEWFEVRQLEMRGVVSPGLLSGEVWQKDRSADWERWPLFLDSWKVGRDVANYLGVVAKP